MLKPINYEQNTTDEVIYAEEQVEHYTTNVVKYSTDFLSTKLSKNQQDNSSSVRNIKQSQVKVQSFKSRNVSNLITDLTNALNTLVEINHII